MANRRMISKEYLANNDAFYSMPLSTQALYYHLILSADDDGFIGAPKNKCNEIGAKPKDLNMLIEKRFVIAFESGVVVIKAWNIHNYISPSKKRPTLYQKELNELEVKADGSYTEKQARLDL